MATNKTFTESDWSVGSATPPIALNHHGGRGALQLVVTGTIQFDLQSTNSDLQLGATAQWLADSTDNENITASRWVRFDAVPRFIRLSVDSFTTGATVTVNYTQED